MEYSRKELIKGLQTIERLCDPTNPTHESIWRIAYSLINSAQDESPSVQHNEDQRELCNHKHDLSPRKTWVHECSCGYVEIERQSD